MGAGGKTVLAVARHSFSTPTSALSSVTVFTLVSVLVWSVGTSHTVFDDIVIVAVVVLLAVAIYLQSSWLMPMAERMNDKVVWRIPTTEPVAALTIDDVPLFDKPSVLENILDVLKLNKVTATFMVMSGFDLPEASGGMDDKSRQRCRNLLKRAVAEGHELANHLQFDKPAISMSNEQFDEAFLHCDKLIAELSGESFRSRSKRWFRPASAVWNAHMLQVAEEHGYTAVIGNCHPFDAADASRHLNSTFLKARVKRGCIVIVHDRWHTPKTLEKALPIIAEHTKLVTLSELQGIAAKCPGKEAATDNKKEG